MLNPDINYQQKLAEYRRKSADGTITLDEMRDAVRLMRQGRVSAVAASAKAHAKKTAPATINSDDLLAQLGDLP